MKTLHIVPELNAANGVYVVARLLACEGGDAEVVGLDEGLRRIGEADVDEVWVHGMWLPKEWAACRRVLKAGKRLVRMTHGSLSPVYLKNQSPIKKWLVGPIERWALRRCAKIVATCGAEKAWIEAYLGKRCPEIVVEDIKRFFDFSRKDRKENEGNGSKQEIGNKKLNVLYLGRRHPLKGVEFLEAAVAELNAGSRSRESSSRPLRVGATRGEATKPSDREAELDSGIGNFDSRQIELKIVSDAFGDEKEKVWDWCDVLVLPTLSENFGLVVAEALERGKRVVTTDGAPAWEELGVSDQGVGVRGDELVYLRGFRDGSEKERVKLLKDALMMMV